MNIECDKNKLCYAINNVQKAVAVRSSITALEGILLTAKENKLFLKGYNLELGITTQIPAEISKGGEIILNSKLFGDIIRNVPDEQITIKADDNFITNIKSGLSEFSIAGMESSEYPELPEVSKLSCVKISSDVLKSMIKQTIFAVSLNEAKPIYTGILFEINNQDIKLVAVDGCRLAVRTEKLLEDCNKTLKFVVPGKTLSELLKLLIDDETVNIYLGDRHIVFETENFSVISRLLEGDFLDYKAAIPEGFKTKARVNTKNLVSCVERVSLMVTDRIKSPIRCIVDKNEIKVSCETAIGKANDILEVISEGESLEIGFNNRYFLDALKNSDTDEVLIEFSGDKGPIKILPTTSDDFLFLVLPVKLRV